MRRRLGSSLLALATAALLASPAAAQDMSGAMTVQMNASGDGGASGEAMVHAMGDSTTVMITLRGLEPNSRHAAHVHNGSCSGGVMHPLQVVVADGEGTGTSSSTVAAAPEATWWLQVHRAESPPGPGISCGQVMP
jgi:Cu/Zn superoxide dismutase